MYDEQLTFLESSDFADEQWYLRESAEHIEDCWEDYDDSVYNIMALEQAKSAIKEMVESFTELNSVATTAIYSIDSFIDEYLKVS